jgi:hypothetical protein
MDKLEYIPGDLVMTNGVPCGTAKGVVYKVTSSDPSKTFELDDGTVLKGVVRLENLEGVEFGDKGYLFGDCCAWVKDIVPINLVPAILEKNGWEIVSCRDGEEIYTRGGTCRFTRLININAFYLDGARYNTTGQWLIKYVHELQHHLWVLGINDNMEV